MNKVDISPQGSFLEYQASRLQALINEMVKCCEDRKIYENQKFGLPYAEIKCLLLFQGERYLTVKSIASRLDVAKSRVTKLINGLLAKGYVERIDDPKDTRVKLISLTQAGRKKIQEVESFHLSLHKKLIQCIDPEDRGELLSYLEQLRNGMEEVKQEFA
jgi:DNA-binding MarR family transcriptional regulator